MHVRNLLNVKQELLYQCNPITVVTIIAEYHNTIYSECGLAKCNKIDQWDAATGVRVAKRRALRKIEEAIEASEKVDEFVKNMGAAVKWLESPSVGALGVYLKTLANA